MDLSRLPALALAALAAAALAPFARASYGWPLAPFDRQHSVRGFFDDPRQEGSGPGTFHFGVDIVGATGTPVYSVAAGLVRVQPDGVALVADAGDRTFSYWHVTPTVVDATHVAAGEQVATIKPGFGHVHFVERHGAEYVNPLRPGGMEPYVDTTSPTVSSIVLRTGGRAADPARVHGTVDLLVDAYDTPSPAPPRPWDGARVAPAYIRWRVVGVFGAGPWRTALDFRSYLAPRVRFASVYDLAGTRLNRPDRPGRFLFFLAHGWDSRRVPDGRYRLEVAAFDSQGNSARSRLTIDVANG